MEVGMKDPLKGGLVPGWIGLDRMSIFGRLYLMTLIWLFCGGGTLLTHRIV
jgi:hypothetical protein